MAATATARALTETYRLAQARLAARSVKAMRSLWPLLDPEQLDATFPRWVEAVANITSGQRALSAQLAAKYLTQFKTLELGAFTPAPPIVLSDVVEPAQLVTSLLVTGPVALKRSVGRGALLTTALRNAEASSANAVTRHVLGGGRDTITDTITADPHALGWARATSGHACSFCAMLASRGPVYKSEGTAGFQAHDGCHCAPEPVYQADAPWPAGSDGYHDLWQQAKDQAGGEGVKPVVMFRRLIESRA